MFLAEEQETINSYDKIAALWAATLSDDFWSAEYKKFTGFLPTGKILDLGCGSGRDISQLLKYGYKCTGVDASEELIKLAKAKNPEAEFFVSSFYDLRLFEKSFDGLWAAHSLLHIPKQNISGILNKIKTFLKPGAVAFVSMKEGNGEKMIEWQQSGFNRYFVYYSQDEFAKILKDAGFGILEGYKFSNREKNQDGTFLVYFAKLL